MIIETDSRCDICGWELFAKTWMEPHGEQIVEYYCRNGCDFDLEKEFDDAE